MTSRNTPGVSRSSQPSSSQRRHRSRSQSRYADLEKPKKKKALSATNSLVSIPNAIKLSMLNSGLLSFDKVKLSARDENNPLSQTIPDTPTELRHFVKLCEQRRKFPVLYKLEFQTAVKVETNSCRHATKKINLEKNQNQKCIPYDYNRVVLQKIDRLADSDYVNASKVDSLLKPNAYIVTQGPTEETVLDFWRMVWQENVSAIVMLTKTFDFTKVMCVQYWPASKEKGESYGDIHISIAKEEELANFQIRTFRLFKKNGDVITEERYLLQFHYTEWHSHTCPFSNAILEFRRRVRAVVGNIIKANSRVGPMLVHCNDGGGRSGVYLAIDANMELAEEEDSFHVFGYLKKLRQSRKGLIENVDQYKFVYDTLEEYIVCGISWFPVKELSQRLKQKSVKDPVTKMNDYQKEYAQICKQTPRFTIGDCAGGHRGDNREKNRDVLCVPPDNFRPYLTSFQGNAFTDYINAVFVDGYTKPREYIVTEWPVKQCSGEFWSLVYDHECAAVVVLCQPPPLSQQYPSFWPEGRHSKKYGPVFTIDHISHNHYTNIKTWVFRINKKVVSLTELMAGVKAPPKTVQLFQLICWPMGHKVPTSTNSLVELMNMVERWRQKTDYGPVAVVSPDGRSRSGVYCAANACIEQVIQHGEVDIFQAVKTVRRHRPQLVDNMTEYKYCYDLVLHYVLHYLNKDLKEKKFIEFGRGKSIPLTPEYANSNIPNQISNTGRIIVKKNISKLDKNEQILNYNSDKYSNKGLEERRYVIDKNGKLVERKTKVRLHSLGGYDPPRKGNRGRLDRLKTVGTFDLGNEMSVLSAVARNLNEQIINTQMSPFAMLQPQHSVILGGGMIPPNAVSPNTSDNINSAQASKDNAPQMFSSLIRQCTLGNHHSNFSADAAKLDLSSDLSASSCSNSILVNRDRSLTPTATHKKEKRIKYYEDTAAHFLSPYEKKVRSLSTGSCLFKKSKALADNKFASLDIKKCTSNEELVTTKKNFTLSLGPQTDTSNRLGERISSYEDFSKVGANVGVRPSDVERGTFQTAARKPILRKSKRITRTDSEFLRDHVLTTAEAHVGPSIDEESVQIDIHIENVASQNESFESEGGKRREGSSDIDDILSPREMYKSTDESSRNMSTDDLDTVFSDNTDLEQLEKEYKEHMRTNLQREYKSDGDNLDEIGRKRNDFCKWKNQSFENELDFFDDDDEDLRNKRRADAERAQSNIENDIEIENISSYSSDPLESSLEKPDEEEASKKESESVIEKIEDNPEPKETEADKQPSSSDDSKKSDKSKPREHKLFSEGSLTNLFEKRFGKFKKMNKLLKCKRFSTSALYDRNKNQQTSKESIFSSSKSTEKTDEKSLGSKPKSSPSKSNIFGSKHSICSTKSFFGGKTNKGFTFRGKKYLFSDSKSSDSKSSDESNTKYRTSPTRYNSKKGNRNGATEPAAERCVSPLSEAFYNPTGSVRLSAMELFEKFCSQDFGGLYKHETFKHEDRFEDGGASFAESHHIYQQNAHKNLGAIKKYNNSRNAKLLRQKSEPKFSSRHDAYYENSPNYGMYYHQEEDENYYDEEDENNLEEYQYAQGHHQAEYYDEYGLVPRRYGDYYDDEYEEDEVAVAAGNAQDIYYEEDDENFTSDNYREEDEEGEEAEGVAEGEGDEEEEEDEEGNIKDLYISPNTIYKESPRQSETTDSDVDEIFLMPGKLENYNNYQLQNKNFLIQQTFFKADDMDMLASNSTTNLKGEASGGSVPANISILVAGGPHHYEIKDTLTIYRISSKDNILDGPSTSGVGEGVRRGDSEGGEDDVSGGDKPEESSLENALNQYIKDVPTDLSVNIDAKIDPFYMKSDNINLDRTESIELLSNSSGTMRSNSTITEYAFDTVRNLHLDSCSTSKLSLSLKSEVFDDFNLSPDETKPMKNYDIEDFTLTPDESISETEMRDAAIRREDGDGDVDAEGEDATSTEQQADEDFVKIVDKFLKKELTKCSDVELGIEAAETTDAGEGEGVSEACEAKSESGDNAATNKEIERQPSSEMEQSQSNDDASKYTIIDLDEESSTGDSCGGDGETGTGISAFTNELTKEFDILFTRAQLRTDEAEADEQAAADDKDSNKLSASDNTVGSLPSRFSMQKLEPIPITELEEMATASARTATAVVCAISAPAVVEVATEASATSSKTPAIATTAHHQAATSSSGGGGGDGRSKGRDDLNKLKLDEIKVNVDNIQIDKKSKALHATNEEKKSNVLALKKIRSQSLGNLNKKSKCFPL